MKGISLNIYTYEQEKHHGILLHEWLLQLAKKQGIPLASVFRAISGYGKDRLIHEEHFFELGSNVPIKIELICSEKECDVFLNHLSKENLHPFHTKHIIET